MYEGSRVTSMIQLSMQLVIINTKKYSIHKVA